MNRGFGMKRVQGGASWHTIFVLLVLAVLSSIYGCSSKTQVYEVGESLTDFGTGISVYSELSQQNLLLRVDNLYGIDYKLWVTYECNCPKKRMSSREEVYAGNEVAKEILVDIPKKEKDCVQRIGIKIKDSKGKVIYSSPSLTTFHIGEIRNE
jgi:hypothetical protein